MRFFKVKKNFIGKGVQIFKIQINTRKKKHIILISSEKKSSLPPWKQPFNYFTNLNIMIYLIDDEKYSSSKNIFPMFSCQGVWSGWFPLTLITKYTWFMTDSFKFGQGLMIIINLLAICNVVDIINWRLNLINWKWWI